ncbi:Pentalenene oxygenase [Mycobacterium basiliense]|uniref:Pentalenene oxygenase n=1 Tax=Mycobacterium basiliense TaxID=2094119 RepID=A0A3S4C098_9MYCO|nr:cytochrome P450 [Mycobacterium basiliense]VDM91163.1 Pentalenene oxygenase [Mycobacterium basiliense]
MVIGALPAGPRLPVGVQTAAWIANPWAFMERAAARYGDTFTMRLAGEGTWVMMSHPDSVREVFTAPPKLLRAGAANRILLPVVGANSVLLRDDDAHREQRRLLVPPFRGDRLKCHVNAMADIAHSEIADWPRGEPVPLHSRMQALTLEVILRAVLGASDTGRLGQLRAELVRVLSTAAGSPGRLLLLVLSPQRVRAELTRRLFSRVDRLLIAEIQDRRGADSLDERNDITSMLLRATQGDGRPLSDVEVRDEVMTLLLAGHETTATALAWAVECIVAHPAVQDRLVEELRCGSHDFLDAIVKETLRLLPVFSLVPRRLTASMEIGGRLLPAGVTVVPSIYLMHRRPDVYPDPERFRPERFLEQRAGAYTWIPFGGGVRRCLGAAFGQHEMRIVLGALFGSYQVRPVAEKRQPGRATVSLGWRPVPEPCQLRVTVEP